MKDGRKTTLDDDMLKKAEGYLETCNDSEYQTAFGVRTLPKLPSISGLALYLKVRRTVLWRWYEKWKDADPDDPSIEDMYDDKRDVKREREERRRGRLFSNIYEEILAEQEERLLNKGLGGQYNANIAKLALGKHGYKERHDQTSNDKEVPVVVTFGASHREIMEAENG